MMKKALSALLILVLLFAAAAVCEEAIRIGALKGPTAMGMVGMMRDCPDYAFTLEGSADALTPALIKGDLDIAAVPANLASILYNNSNGAIRVIAVNTLGVLYLVERGETINSLEDLRGRTIVTAGKGATPEYALNRLLIDNDLIPDTDVTIEFKSEHSECLAALLNDDSLVAMLPQPFATVALSKADDMRIALDLNAVWESQYIDSALVTGVAVARSEWIDAHPKALAEFRTNYAASVDLVLNNIPEAASLIGDHEIFEAAVAEKALPFCNITYIDGTDMVEKLGGYLACLYEQNPAAVGGKLPDETFYCLD